MVYSSPNYYPAAAPGWDPVEESTTALSVSRTSQPRPDIGPPPPLPMFQAGDLENYEGSFERGNSGMETEELNLLPPPYPRPDFQAGELRNYEFFFDHGNDERETEEQGFVPPPPPFELSAASSSDGYLQPVPPAWGPVGPSQYYLFLTGQLPPGTQSHFQSEYETGRDHWDDVHYERYHFPTVLSPAAPPQAQDGQWTRSQKYIKS